jgi:hypothetical protein
MSQAGEGGGRWVLDGEAARRRCRSSRLAVEAEEEPVVHVGIRQWRPGTHMGGAGRRMVGGWQRAVTEEVSRRGRMRRQRRRRGSTRGSSGRVAAIGHVCERVVASRALDGDSPDRDVTVAGGMKALKPVSVGVVARGAVGARSSVNSLIIRHPHQPTEVSLIFVDSITDQ